MPASVGDSSQRRPPTEHSPPGSLRTQPPPPGPPRPATNGATAARPPERRAHQEHEHHHVLIEPEEDRWAWRRRIRQNPRRLAVYRVAVAFAGSVMIALGCLTGPLPGPGGIPLVLLGLAIWASEFEWAHKVMQWFKGQLKRYKGWTPVQKVVFWLVFFLVCGSLGYLYLLGLGVPFWMPSFAEDLLQRLPGV